MPRRALLVVLLTALLSVAWAQLGTISGTYNVNYCGKGITQCGAFFYACHDLSTGMLQGVYSNIGFINGYLDDTNGNFTGEWYEAGTAGPIISSTTGEAYPNFGTITLQFTSTGAGISATGTALYDGYPSSIPHFTFSLTSASLNRPTNDQCWFDASNNATTNGAWIQSSANSAKWPQCVTNGNYSLGSYTFGGVNGETGAVIGPCYLGASLCTFDLVSQTTTTSYRLGIGLARRVGNQMYTVRWIIVGPKYFEFLSISDWSYQSAPSVADTWTLDTFAVSSGSPFPIGCAENYLLLGSAAAIKASLAMVLVAVLALIL